MDVLGECCAHLQNSHLHLSRNDLVAAKKEVIFASNGINSLLASHGSDPLVRNAAKFTIDYYKSVLAKGTGALSIQQRISWLNSSVHGRFWYPILPFGSFNVLPSDRPDEQLLLPTLEPNFVVELKNLESSSSSAGPDALLSLHQDILTNCSFVSSLISITELGMGSHLKNLVSSPANGLVKVKLLVNGSFRETTITTQLPVLQEPNQHRSLFVRSSDETLLWPAYLEKAFLMLSGEDYQFTGSNMAKDTYTLTGWLPEIRRMSSVAAKDFEQLWNYKKTGQLMLGLGTGVMSQALAKSVGVIPEHDYVLSGFDPQKEIVTLTNPWAAEADRLLDVPVASLCHFDYVYLNWKPSGEANFQTSLVCTPSKWPHAYLGDKPQFSVCNESPTDQKVTILVEQFLSDSSEFCVSVWSGARHTLYSTSECVSAGGGEYSNFRYQMLSLTLEKHHDYIISISSRSEKPSTFALTVFGSKEIQVSRTKSKFPFNQTIEGNWTSQTDGGNWANETFIDNPQYDLVIGPQTTNLFLALGADTNAAINMHLLHCEAQESGKRIRNFDHSKLVFSQSYNRSLHYRDVPVSPGHYKLIVSTYEPGTGKNYRLLVANDGEQVELQRTPQAIGTYVQNYEFEWNNSNRRKIFMKPAYRGTTLTVHLRTGEMGTAAKYRPAIRASVFDGFTSEPVVVNSQWNDCVYGVFIDCEFPENNRDYVLLVERFEMGSGKCRLTFGSSHKLTLEDTK